jgi:pimeloyl-ACP methyl ester carboxylesterase
MPLSLSKLTQNLFRKSLNGAPSGDGSTRTRTIVTGSVAIGALVTGAVLEKTRRDRLPRAQQLPKAIDAEVEEMEIMEGRVRYYKRPGSGVPIVLLHSINAAASSFEMRPIFEHLAAHTDRPIYAMDWLGFGISDRPPARYTPGLYQRQLRRFLSERLRTSADIIALSLASEYAATVAHAFPVLVRRLVFISPTGLGDSSQESMLQQAVIGVASSVGAFEVFFARLTQRAALRNFYAEHVFMKPENVPAELVEYAYVTTHAKGAHQAPRRFIQGTLSMKEYAPRTYTHVQAPTLLVIPEADSDMVQDFARAPEIAAANGEHIRLHKIYSGLLPQWEAPQELFDAIDEFLGASVQA